MKRTFGLLFVLCLLSVSAEPVFMAAGRRTFSVFWKCFGETSDCRIELPPVCTAEVILLNQSATIAEGLSRFTIV